MTSCHRDPLLLYEPQHEETYKQIQHKPSCTSTEDGEKLEIFDLESRGIVLSV